MRLPMRVIRFPRRPLVMGIVNLNDDSFSGDGRRDLEKALQHAGRQVEGGADLIDVGLESARTNRAPIPEEEEIERFGAFFAEWGRTVARLCPVDAGQVWPPVVSANTWRPRVVEALLGMGVELINDMGGLADCRNAALCARHGAALLLMHTVGAPKTDQTARRWDDIIGELRRFFLSGMARARRAGLTSDRIILDPGIDFAKPPGDGLTILREVEALGSFERPVLLPVSRKTVIGETLGIESPADRDAGTLACLAAGVRGGAGIFRVHNVEAAWQALKVLWAIRQAGDCAGVLRAEAARFD